jgi:anaerobic selenocysteine-containing dehydrogenase
MHTIVEEGLYDLQYVQANTEGFEELVHDLDVLQCEAELTGREAVGDVRARRLARTQARGPGEEQRSRTGLRW